VDRLNINLINCFGIGEFKKEFDFANTNIYLIYAPNGTMKSSFARVFELISEKKEKEICDRVYYNRKTVYSITDNGSDIKPETIFVVNAEKKLDSSDKISSFIASKELKNRYDSIYIELDNAKKDFLKQLKKIAISTDCEEEFVKTFQENDKDDFFSCVSKIVNLLKESSEKFKFKFNDIFDKPGKVKDFLEKNKDLLQDYFLEYKKLLAESSFFKELSGNSFGTYQAEQLKKAVEDETFFSAGHKFLLNDEKNIKSSKDLVDLIKKEIDAIFESKKLQEIFNKIDKSLNANKELRVFKETIEKDKSLIPKLLNYDKFKKEVLISYFSQLKKETEQLNSMYQNKKKEIQKIIEEANKETETWKKITKTFNSRFYVPFKVDISNKEDVILKDKATANLVFNYKDGEEAFKTQTKDDLLKFLSKGEQRAYYILQMIFEVEARKYKNEETLIIFDDIADSFDYKNKYAIIEYIKDLKESNLFKIIVLTHNFDFYRTIGSRLYIKNYCFMATKDNNRKINLLEGCYFYDVFANVFIRKTEEQKKMEPKIFVSFIPFIRNLVEYTEGKNNQDYTKLTSCLHYKSDTKTMKAGEIISIIKSKIDRLKNIEIDFGKEKFIDFIFKTADGIYNEQNIDEIALENKIVLSIAIRLYADKFMIESLKINIEDLNDKKNQTSYLLGKYKNRFSDDSVLILEEVNLMTPENIHINAFMYEPLVDMSVLHLLNLYSNIKNLKK